MEDKSRERQLAWYDYDMRKLFVALIRRYLGMQVMQDVDKGIKL